MKLLSQLFNAAAGYLKGLGMPITQLYRTESVQKWMAAGLNKFAESGKQVTDVDHKEPERFVQQVVGKI